MKFYKIICEWEMPLANGVFKTIKKAKEAINKEDWECYTEYNLKEVIDNGFVSIVEIDIIK